MKFIVMPNAEGAFRMEISEGELELARVRAFNFISMLDSTPVIGDRAKLAFELHYMPNYFMSRTVVYSGWSRKWMNDFFKDSSQEEEIEVKN